MAIWHHLSATMGCYWCVGLCLSCPYPIPCSHLASRLLWQPAALGFPSAAVSTGMLHQSSWHHNNVNNNCLSFPGKELRAVKEACREHAAESESGTNSDYLTARSLVNLLLSPGFVASLYVFWVTGGLTVQYPLFWLCLLAFCFLTLQVTWAGSDFSGEQY